MLGGLLGKAWKVLWPDDTPFGAYAVIGSASLLAVSLQGPLAASVFAIELVGTTDVIIVPILIACVTAVLISRFLHSPSVYTARLHKSEAQSSADLPDVAAEAPEAVDVVVQSSKGGVA